MKLRPAVLLLALVSALPPAARAADDAEGPPKIAGVDVPAPKRTKSVRPQYPPEAQAVGMRGIVILELLVGPDGKVTTAKVTRSVPPFDDAALAAVRQWEYEITKVDGKPVSVVITVPIEFKMSMPEMAREDGIPELRQGVGPVFPAGATEDAATVTAEVTVDPDGHVAEAHVKSGESPWAEALIQALRTWRFTPLDSQGGLAFDVKADFSSSGKGPHVDLKLTGPRRIDAPAGANTASEPTAPPEVTPSPGAASPAPSPAVAEAAPPAPMPSPGAVPASTPVPSPAPTAAAASPAPSPSPRAAGPAPSPTAPRPTPPPEEVIRNPAGGPPVPPHPPAAGPASPAPGAPATGPDVAASPGATPASPAVAPPPLSAVRDVTLAAGVPDLIRGRRPVSPPLARMQGLSGTVDVNFAVDASGSSSVREVTGPDPLKEAARQTVASWVFRRATTERLFLAATFVYKGDTASVAVKSQE